METKTKKNTRKLPRQVKERQGTLEKSRVIENPLTAACITAPPPPETFDNEQKKHWQTVTDFLEVNGILVEADLKKLEEMVFVWGIMRDSKKAIKKGLIVSGTNSKGVDYEAVNPNWSIYRQSLDIYNKLSNEFGISPIARERITKKSGGGDATDKDFD